MAATHELHNKIDELLASLKGTKPFDFLIALDQLCYLFILKMLDEEEDNRVRLASPSLFSLKPLFPLQTARYRWRHWCGLPAESLLPFVRDEVFSYMASLIREDAQVSEHFRDAQLMMGDLENFKQVVDIISSFEFATMGHDASAEFDRYLIARLVDVSATDSPYIQFPPALSRLMLEVTQPKAGETVFDPSAGVGDLLVATMDHLHINYPNETPGQLAITISGVEISRRLVRIAKVRLMVSGCRYSPLRQFDIFASKGSLLTLGSNSQVILAAPSLTRPAYVPAQDRPSDIAYLQLCMEALMPGGRCAIVVPDAVLSSISRTAIAIRGHLIANFNLLAVIKLSRSALPSALRMNGTLLIFQNPLTEDAPKTKQVWFYHVDQLAATATQEFSIDHFIALWKDYQASNFQRVSGPETITRLPPQSNPPCCWWVKKEQLAQANFNLDAQIWRPEIEDLHANDDPETLVNALLTDYHEIVNGLESLLKEMK